MTNPDYDTGLWTEAPAIVLGVVIGSRLVSRRYRNEGDSVWKGFNVAKLRTLSLN